MEIKTIKDGIVGLAKAAAHIERASDSIINERREICRSCEHLEIRERKDGTMGMTTFSRCLVCKCFLKPKTALATDKCPVGKWDRTSPVDAKLEDLSPTTQIKEVVKPKGCGCKGKRK